MNDRNATSAGSPVERAFELARSGVFSSVKAVLTALKKEGFKAEVIENHFGGRGIRAQLREACKTSLPTR